MKGKIARFIPACNEEKTIGSVVALAKKYGQVFVVDDGSQDRTAVVAKASGAEVISHGRNLGYGAAMRSALLAGAKCGADAIVIMDADMQHDPSEIPRIAEPVLEGWADAAVGSRFLGKMKNASPGRLQGVQLVNALSSLHSGGNIDYQCGFRAFSRKAAGKIQITQNGYEGGGEAVSSALRQHLRVAQVPVTVRYYPGREANPLAQGVGLLAYLVPAVAKRKPLLFFAGAGFAMMLASGLLGIFVVRTFYSKGVLPTGSAFLTVFCGIVGLVLISIGINLYTLEAVIGRGREGE